MRYAIAALAGCAIGYMAMGWVFAKYAWRKCENTQEVGFGCSNCGSHTDYEGGAKFAYCPICGAYNLRGVDL